MRVTDSGAIAKGDTLSLSDLVNGHGEGPRYEVLGVERVGTMLRLRLGPKQ
jgi:hypothetical protein